MIKHICIRLIFYAGLCLVVSYADARAGSLRSYDWWWVFYEREETRDFSMKTYRPLYLAHDAGEGMERKAFYASLLPFVWWAYETPRNYEWKSLFGFIHSVDYTHRSGMHDYDFGLFPFILYGNSLDERDRYLLIWPFGGTIKGKLGQDRITTYLFPGVALLFVFPPLFPPTLLTTAVLLASFVPLYVDYQSHDYHAWAILWPFIQRGKSTSRDDVRILPLYAHNFKRDSYDNYSYFLLVNFSRVFMKNDEQCTLFILPFYGRRWNSSGRVESATLLWPFFSWGYSESAGSFELNFPWPLVQIQQSQYPSIHKMIFFPFYGIYRYEERETCFITPLYFSLKTETQNFRSQYYIGALVFWYFTREYRDKPNPQYGSRWKYLKLWPLFQYESDDRGNISFTTLSLLLWRDPEGYERLYQPFWTIFEYRRMHDGEQRLGLILRLYYQRWSDHFFFIQVPLLFSYGSQNGRVSEVSLLLSMFSYERSDRGTRYRFFWIPFGDESVSQNEIMERQEAHHEDYNDVALISLSQRWEVPAYSNDGFLYWPGQMGLSIQVF